MILRRVAALGISAALLAGCSRGGSTPGGGADVSALQQAVVSAVERAVPSVVKIRTVARFPRKPVEMPRRGGVPSPDDMAEFLEENGGFRENSVGSGVIVSEDGLIVTNEHVIRDSDEILVRLSDRTEHRARIVGADARTDVALLRIQPQRKLPVAQLGDSSRLRVGEWAIAVGNPFGLESTVTVGVISATGRTDVGEEEGGEDFIQTDASINPGNSGGPLLNVRGEVVGINTSMVTAGQGIGFAIPINTVRAVEQDLARNGVVRRGWLGVGIQSLTADLAEAFGVRGEKGVLVNRIYPKSPAASSGLKGGDIIVACEGTPVAGVKEFQKQIVGSPPGKTVRLEILRGGKRAGVAVTVAEMDGAEAKAPALREDADAWGLAVAEIPRRALKELDIDGGVEVGYADPSGPAWEAGIREGDILLRINREPVRTVSDDRALVARAARGQIVSTLVVREGAQIFVAFRVR